MRLNGLCRYHSPSLSLLYRKQAVLLELATLGTMGKHSAIREGMVRTSEYLIVNVLQVIKAKPRQERGGGIERKDCKQQL